MKSLAVLLALSLLIATGCELLFASDSPAKKEAKALPELKADTTTQKEDKKESTEENKESIGKEKLKAKKIVRTDAEWRKKLTAEEYRVLRRKGTERPYVNKYDKHFESGHYECTGCGQVLFESDTKFDSGCGWPAFYAAKAEDRVIRKMDLTFGMQRVEVLCARCNSHLGHVFQDGFGQPTGERFCINSVCLKFTPKKDVKGKQEVKEKQAKPTKETETAEQPAPEKENTEEATDKESVDKPSEKEKQASDSPNESD